MISYMQHLDQIWQHRQLQNPAYTQSGVTALNQLAESIHAANVVVGWWSDPKTGKPIDRNFGEIIALIHSEISEALEGDRTDAMDKHLPHRKNVEVELADAIIRILDLAGARMYDIGGAVFEKLDFNRTRADHKAENRLKKGGKAF